MKPSKVTFSLNFPAVSTVFDSVEGRAPRLLDNDVIRTAILRLLPSDFMLQEGADAAFLDEFQRMLPIFTWKEWTGPSCNFSLFLLAPHRHNGVKFFYEMVSRWLLPGRRLNICSFFATDFTFPELSQDCYTLAEMVISLSSEEELGFVQQHLPIFESELRFGLISVYHANRILEIKGLSADEKTSLIQERIASFIVRRPRYFDYDIFNQMQHFLVMCEEGFRSARTHGHMSRIICVFYLFRKALREASEKNQEQRHVHVKLSSSYLYVPFGVKRVLSLYVGLNFLNENEVFEERHLVRVLNHHFPDLRYVADSFFLSSLKEEKIQLLYLEVEKEDEGNFSAEDKRNLRATLPDEIRNGVEKLMRPVFMPRNEEEVMRNIITLSNQLRYPKDLPQVIISFDEQKEFELSFTVILLRILNEVTRPIHELFEQFTTPLKYFPDRVKQVGLLRNKYVKEATVFRVGIPVFKFLRPDHSVDLFKGRQEVLAELQTIIGEVRDYNGGMIAKQHEQFYAIKSLFPGIGKREDLLLENVFHSIFPVELRSVVDPRLVKVFFHVFIESVEEKREGCRVKREEGVVFFLLSYQRETIKQQVVQAIAKLHFFSSQLITISLQVLDMSYLGYIYRETDEAKQEIFLNVLQGALDI